MWSMSKPVTAIALVQALRSAGKSVSAEVRSAIHWAIIASDDCAQRWLTVQLQQQRGGDEGALSAFSDVLAKAGVHGTQVEGAATDPTCVPEIDQHWPTPQVSAPALQLGTHTWTTFDAARFAYELASGAYGDAGDLVAAQMRLPKARPFSYEPGDYTAPLDEPPSGSNVFPRAWTPGFKGGWGGSTHDDFLSGQIVILDVGGIRIGLAAQFWPNVQPADDNPGLTKAPSALEALFGIISNKLKGLTATR
jgi:hypothetical protein